jgi:nucleotide-binding universal stress UspA family protein
MTITGSRTTGLQATPQSIATEGSNRQPMRVLAVVDGSEDTNRIVHCLAAMASSGCQLEATVLNVQSKRQDRLRGYESFKRAEIDDHLTNDVGMPIVLDVARRLEKLGIRAQTRVEIGEAHDIVLRCAAEQQFDAIVIAEPRPGPLRYWLARNLGIAIGPASAIGVLSSQPVILAH